MAAWSMGSLRIDRAVLILTARPGKYSRGFDSTQGGESEDVEVGTLASLRYVLSLEQKEPN